MSAYTAGIDIDAEISPPGAAVDAPGPQLRRPGTGRSDGYTPTHGTLYAANTYNRSCGRCGVFRPIVGGVWTKRRGLFVASCCAKPLQGASQVPSKGHAA